MVTAVEETRLIDRDVTMVQETETPRPTTAPTGIARPTVRDSPSLTENPMQHRQQPQYSSQGSNSDRESADEELQTEVRLRQAMEQNGRVVDLTERMTTKRDKAMRNPTHWNRSVLDAFVLDNANALVKSAANQSVNFRLARPEEEVILSPLLDDNLARERMILLVRMDQNVGLPSVIRVFSIENKDLYYYMAVAGMEMLKWRDFRMDEWYRRRTETWGTLETFLRQLWESMTLAFSEPDQLQRFMMRYTGTVRTLFFEGVISCILAVTGHPNNYRTYHPGSRNKASRIASCTHPRYEAMHRTDASGRIAHPSTSSGVFSKGIRTRLVTTRRWRTRANQVLEQERQREEQRERQTLTIKEPQQVHPVRTSQPAAEQIPIEAIREALRKIALKAKPKSLPKLELEPPPQYLTTATSTITTTAPRTTKYQRLEEPSIDATGPRITETSDS